MPEPAYHARTWGGIPRKGGTMTGRLQAIPAPLRLAMLFLMVALAVVVAVVATRHGVAPHTGAFVYHGAQPNFVYHG